MGVALPPSVSTSRPLVASSQVTDDDVLLGRGKRSYNHEGNIRFRKIVLSRADAYRQNSNKAFRMALTLEVIKRIESIGGRFLRQTENSEDETDEAEKSFELVAKSVVKTKVKQALRDTAAGLTAAEQQVPRKSLSRMQPTHHPNTSSLPQSNPFMNLLPTASLLPNHLPGSSFQPGNHVLGQGHPNAEYAQLLQMVSLQQLQEGQQTTVMMQALEQQRALQLAQLMEQQSRTASLASRLTPQQQQLLGLDPLPQPMTTASIDDHRGIGNAQTSGVGDLPSVAGNPQLSLRSALFHQQVPTLGGPDLRAASHFQPNNSHLLGTAQNLLHDPSSIPLPHPMMPNMVQQQQPIISHPQPLPPRDFAQHLPQDIASGLSHFVPVAPAEAAAARRPQQNSSSSSSSEGGGMQSIHRSLEKTPFKTEQDDHAALSDDAAAVLALRQQQEFGLVSQQPSMETVDGIVQDGEDTDGGDDDTRGSDGHDVDGTAYV